MYEVSFHDYVPPPRFDGRVWTRVEVEEAAEVTGPWNTLAVITLTPLDTDATKPRARSFTIGNATLAEGFYRVVWLDLEGGESEPSAAVHFTPEGKGIRPAIAEIAALLRARTKVTGGKEEGTFTQATRPTDDQVEDLIDQGLDDVLGKVKGMTAFRALEPTPSSEETEGYERRVRGAVALFTAILVETSYFPEQVRSDQSAASIYEKRYEDRIKALIAEGETGEAQGEGGEGKGADSQGDAYWNFDEPAVVQAIGLSTRF
jgi:hypothetical protein